MKQIPQIALDRQTIIVFAALVLLVIVVGQVGWSSYHEHLLDLEEAQGELFIIRKKVAKLSSLQKKVSRLTRESQRLSPSIFQGKGPDEVLSNVQIDLQRLTSAAGLVPESLRPMGSGKESAEEIQTITIKMRLTGTLGQFQDFLARLYKSKRLFIIKSMTVKSYKEGEIKIFLEINAFYRSFARVSSEKRSNSTNRRSEK